MSETPPPQGGLGQNWFVLDFEAAYGATEPEPEQGSADGASGFFQPVGHRVRFKVKLDGSTARRYETAVSIGAAKIAAFSATVPYTGSGAKRFETHVPLIRHSAAVYAQALREDDELMLILSSM